MKPRDPRKTTTKIHESKATVVK